MTTERYTISSEQLVATVKKMIHEGNVRRVKIIYKKQTLLEVPLTIGASAAAVSIIMVPFLAALGAVAAMVAEVTVEIEKAGDKANAGTTTEEQGPTGE